MTEEEPSSSANLASPANSFPTTLLRKPDFINNNIKQTKQEDPITENVSV